MMTLALRSGTKGAFPFTALWMGSIVRKCFKEAWWQGGGVPEHKAAQQLVDRPVAPTGFPVFTSGTLPPSPYLPWGC